MVELNSEHLTGWRSGSIVGRMNNVTLRRARLVLGWIDSRPQWYITSKLGQLSLASL